MKSTKIVATIMMLFMGGMVYADFFPLIGYNCNRPYGADSCDINTMMFSAIDDSSWMNSIFKLSGTVLDT